MKLKESYKRVKPGIVAIISRVGKHPDFPDIIGTGFMADPDGLIITNKHVLDVMKDLPRHKGKNDEYPIAVLALKETDRGLTTITMEVIGVGTCELGEKPLYGSKVPDIGLIRVAYRNLPALKLKEPQSYEEGEEIATAGYPLGHLLLRNGGNLDHLGPTLKRGVIGSVLPFPCEFPHALLLNMMSQGGASGSPIFEAESGDVLGVLYAGVEEPRQIHIPSSGSQPFMLQYSTPTDITYAVPAYLIKTVIEKAKEDPKFQAQKVDDIKDYAEFIDKNTPQAPPHGFKGIQPIAEDDLILPGSG